MLRRHEKQLVPPINLGKVKRPFPNNVKSITLQLEKDYSPVGNTEDSLQSLQECTSQQIYPKARHYKKRNPQELHLRFEIPQLAC